ncbi:3-deoxy-D-manno-octulosonic acid transferase [Tabrizicola sp. J26]|uniref:3-deoxy-D-manno-octulosonic acid transferase n=1 Tax=Alitabrizicola rongguiensis TaxID=2909234 RepID=UPI001F4078CB|nr:glycosyltransferase N-terminal domain-containing protein [Tabrizicola rongguiensis]MCF1709476.1 3-deoxy-D-manno-octulosonic acid transferase [Tabrizicola rongguiensis]
MTKAPYPTLRIRLFLLGYALLWVLALPAILLYIRRRARKDADYGTHLGERFGRSHGRLPDSVWIHAVSLGEMRSATPLIRALLDRGERVVTTHFTPAGRREAAAVFAREIAEGRLVPVWVPFEFDFAYRRFFNAYRPRYGLVMEIEIWPRMIASAHRHGVPLFMCNAQYPSKSLARDARHLPIRAAMMTGFAGALVKSDLQRARFESVGVTNIAVTGELRFEQPVPQALVEKGLALRRWFRAEHRPVFAFASVVEGEDAIFLAAIHAARAEHHAAGLPAPLVLYIPRAPERFGAVADLIRADGLAFARRSEILGPDLSAEGVPPTIDVLLCDSLGEMYAWLAMADRVSVGGGFTPKGSHNISEPLTLRKPVMVGPDIHTIEYPAKEAIAAGVCRHLASPGELCEALGPHAPLPSRAQIDRFLSEHGGGVDKTLAALPELLAAAR